MSAKEEQPRGTLRRDFLCLGAGLVVGGAAAYMFTPKPEPTTFSGRDLTLTTNGSFVKPASYIIFKDGSTIKAVNGTTGAIDYSGTDAATVINNAIAALTSGGVVFIKAGNYVLTTSILIGLPNITLAGEGVDTVISCTANSSFNLVVAGNGVPAINTTIKNLKIDATNQVKADALYGIVINSTSNNSKVLGCEVMETGHGAVYILAPDCTVADNYIHDTFGDNIILQSTGQVVSRNICDTTGLHNNISLVSVTNSIIANNICRNSANYGIALENLGTGPCTGIVVADNMIYSCHMSGIRVYPQWAGVDSADYCTLEGNVIASPVTGGGTTYAGIDLHSGAHIQIVGNHIYNSGYYGILVILGNNVLIGSNRVVSSANAGITIASAAANSHISVCSNSVNTSIAGSGIIFAGSGSTYIKVVQNEVTNPHAYGIDIQGVTYLTVNDNIVSGTAGILIESSSTKGVCNCNVIYGSGSGGTGIHLYNAVTYMEVGDNYVENFGYGIREENNSSDYNMIYQNNVTNNNTYKISVAGTHTVIKDNLGYNPQAIASVSVGTSPYAYHNTDHYPEDVIVSGGTVSDISWSRDGSAYYATGVTAGKFRLEPSEYLKVTYSVAPTMTKCPL